MSGHVLDLIGIGASHFGEKREAVERIFPFKRQVVYHIIRDPVLVRQVQVIMGLKGSIIMQLDRSNAASQVC